MKTVLHWFRRDLRLTDNTALHAAARAAETVVPVFIRSAWRGSHCWTGPHRQAFLCGSLASLDANLRTLGSRLIVRSGDAVEELGRLARETGAEAIFFNRDPDPFGRATEERLHALGLPLHAYKDACLHERDEVLTATGTPFRVFTPYFRAWSKLPKLAPAGKLRALSTPASIASEPLPTLADWGLAPAGEIVESGECAARARLEKFLSGPLSRYGAERDFPGIDGTSRLSQDLRFGLLSIREVFAKADSRMRELSVAARVNAEKFLGELAWREFYMQILWHWPEVLAHEFDPKYRGLAWRRDERAAARWRAGETGFPIVDAAMRELSQTGHMHNRARMIVAMFLTKDLQLDWRLGEQWFMEQLVDGEIASNNGGWQWSAGTGADAAPYFRIQNPWTQGARYDPEALYIKTWLPELRDIASEKLHRPPAPGLSVASGYPPPLVDHAEAREQALAMFRQHRA